MSGWSNSDDQNDFKVETTDFTLTNFQDEAPTQQESVFDSQYSRLDNPTAGLNYFYQKLGFKVGECFSGEKKLYQKRK